MTREKQFRWDTDHDCEQAAEIEQEVKKEVIEKIEGYIKKTERFRLSDLMEVLK